MLLRTAVRHSRGRKEMHRKAVGKILSYLNETSNFGAKYQRGSGFAMSASADADYASKVTPLVDVGCLVGQ